MSSELSSRLCALIFASGLGVTLATGSATAAADTGSESSPPSATTSSSPAQETSDPSSRPEDGLSSEHAARPDADGDDADDDDAADNDDLGAEGESNAAEPADAAGDGEDGPSAEELSDAEPQVEPVDNEGSGGLSFQTPDAAVGRENDASEEDPADPTESGLPFPGDLDHPAMPVDDAEDLAATDGAAAAPQDAVIDRVELGGPEGAAASAVTQPVSASIGTELVRRGPLEWLVAGAFAIIGLAPSDPAAPVENPIVAALLAWSRRVDSFFFGHTPTAAPVQTNNGSVVVTGTLGAADADGDKLAYRLQRGPSAGSVVINADGTYTYTASAELAIAGGTDTFVVVVRERGIHLHLLGGRSSISVPVSVVVAANAAPVQHEPTTVLNPGQSTGVVSGGLHVTDPNGDPLTYRLASGPEKGAVVLTGDGGFVYRPREAARVRAGALDADDQDMLDNFTVTVSDGVSATDVTVTVPVAPLHNTIVGTIRVGDYPQAVAVGADGRYLYVTHLDGRVSVVDVAAGSVVGSMGGGDSAGGLDDDLVEVGASGIAISADGSRIFVANPVDDTVSVIEVASNSVSTIEVGDNPTVLALSADNARAYVVNAHDNSVSVIDTATRSVIATVVVGAGPSAMALSADGARLYVSNHTDGTVTVIDTSTSVASTISVGGNPSALAVSADGSRIYVSDSSGGVLSVFDTTTGRVIASVEVGQNPSGVAVSSDGHRAYVTNAADNTVSIVDLSLNRVTHTLRGVGSTPIAITINADGTRAYVASANSGTVTVVSIVPETGLSSSRGFNVYNFTDKPLTLDHYVDNLRPEGGPPLGYVLRPGQGVHFEVTRYFPSDSVAVLAFRGDDGVGYDVRLGVDGWDAGRFGGCSYTSGGGRHCDPASLGHNDQEIFLLDAPGSTIVVPAGEGQRQVDLVNQLCQDGQGSGRISCSFAHKQEVDTYGMEKPVGSAVRNNTDLEQSYSVAITDTVSASDSLQISAKAAFKGLKGFIDLEIQATYGHTWTSTHQFTQTLNVKVSPHFQAAIYAQQPVWRVYGDLTVVMGSTTYVLKDVYFDSPNPEGLGLYEIRATPIPGQRGNAEAVSLEI
ncbi:hypothetical protein ACNUDN_03550 [Mycobacterium sp. smrl_JER01]